MNDPWDSYPRWRAAEASERDDDADEAFRDVFQSVAREQPVSLDFTAGTMKAVAAAAAVDARRARQARVAVLTALAPLPVRYASAPGGLHTRLSAFLASQSARRRDRPDGRSVPERLRNLGCDVEPG
jgi:hypothetical protein